MLSRKLAAAVSATIVGLTSLTLAQPASAAVPGAELNTPSVVQPQVGPRDPCSRGDCAPIPVAADCSGRTGNLNAHSYTRYSTPLLKYDVPTSQQIGTAPADARITIYYRDDRGDIYSKAFWAVKYKKLCGYVRGDHILWNKTW